MICLENQKIQKYKRKYLYKLMKSEAGAGILPITIRKGKAWVMLGRESRDMSFPDSGKWSDFGGGVEKGETVKKCAAREGFEETMGMFGGPVTLMKLINDKLACKLTRENYTSFAIHVKYIKTLPKDFADIYRCAKEEDPKLIEDDNGFFEKDRVQWFKLEKLRKREYDIILRDHFKSILSDLCGQLL